MSVLSPKSWCKIISFISITHKNKQDFDKFEKHHISHWMTYMDNDEEIKTKTCQYSYSMLTGGQLKQNTDTCIVCTLNIDVFCPEVTRTI